MMRLRLFLAELPQHKARLALVAIGALCALGILFGSQAILKRDRESALHTENERGKLLAGMLESHITRTLNSVDNNLNVVGDMLLRSPAGARHAAAPSPLQSQLDTMVSGASYLRSISILDSSGKVIISSTAANIGRHFFQAQLGLDRMPDNMLQIGRPLFAHDLYELDERMENDSLRDRGVYALPLAKQMRVGASTLTLLALVHPSYLFPEARTAALDRSYAVLFDYQGMALAATPNAPYAVGKRHARLPIISALNHDQEFGLFRMPAEATPGAGAHLLNFQASPRFPIAATVGVSESDVLSAWENSARNLRLIGVLAALLGLGYTLMLNRVMRSGERTREELRRARDAAENANTAKSVFLSTMSHEIRTPMNGVLGMTALLRETPLDARQQEFARTIEESAGALMSIINDILDFSKIEAGRMDLEPVPSSILQLAESCIELLWAKASEKSLELIPHIDPALPASVLIDGGRLRQILLNLLHNAIKFTPAGTITLRIALLEREQGVCRIGFDVIDTGIGIAPQAMPRLFQPFTQADHSVTRKYGGTGLGLSICKRLLEMMGSAISVESALGRGSSFRFELQLLEVAGPASMSDLPAVPALVMTAHARQTEMLMECLRHWGMQACFAADAAAAQASVQAMEVSPPGQHPLALLDAALPDVEALARSLLAVRSDLRLLLLTRGGDMHDADDLVFHALLPLPIRHGRLGEALRFIQERRQYRLPVLHERRTEVSAREEDTGKLILLAEDNPTNRTLAMHQLARIGFEADVVENGEQALAALAQHDYALVLMDCQMPVMDGFEATRRIRERERETGRHVSIIAMTANAMEGDRERCLEAGMDDYLSKPVRSETLAGMLRRHLPAQQENAAQVLDEAHLSELFGEDRDMRRSLLQGFYDGASPLQRKLDAALAAENFEDIGRIAHQLVGSAANLGARELEALAQSLRLAVRERDAQAARRLHAELEKAWRRFADYLSRDVS